MPTPQIPIEILNARLPKECILTAIEYTTPHISKAGASRGRIICLCQCGNNTTAIVGDITRGKKLSCGCLPMGRKEITKHRRLYHIWWGIIHRCNDLNNKYYGGKGVKVCPEWAEYKPFEEWALNNGYNNQLYIDKDILGDGMLYSPSTCKWVTPFENSCNRSTSKKFECNGKLLTLHEIAIYYNIPYRLLKTRVQ